MIKTKQTSCKELIPTSELACVRNFTMLYDSVFANTKKADEEDLSNFLNYVEKIFVFSLIWSVGATLVEQSRREIDMLLRDIEPMFPHANTVYEYYVNPDKKDYDSWEFFIPNSWRPNPNSSFYDIYVPTIDTCRYNEILKYLLKIDHNVMFVGYSGVGKTKRIESFLNAQTDPVEAFTINFSAGTTAPNVQSIIESHYKKQAKNKFKPINSMKKAIAFIDDFNMPRKEVYGA